MGGFYYKNQQKNVFLVQNIFPQTICKATMKVLIHTQKGARIEKTANIMYCEADKEGTKIHLIKKSSTDTEAYFISTKQLKDMADLLPEISFYRCQKSYIVNFLHFHEFDVATNSIVMKNGVKIPISRRKKAVTKQKLMAYIEKYNEKHPF